MKLITTKDVYLHTLEDRLQDLEASPEPLPKLAIMMLIETPIILIACL